MRWSELMVGDILVTRKGEEVRVARIAELRVGAVYVQRRDPLDYNRWLPQLYRLRRQITFEVGEEVLAFRLRRIPE